MECRDRYFMIAVDLSFTGDEPRFEAVGKFCTASFIQQALCEIT